MLARGVENFFGRHHHAEVDHLIAIAAQHYADDILADVVHVTLDRGHDDAALGSDAGADFFRLDVGQQMGHRLLHHARRFHHLGQKHFAGAEQVADHIHAGHQRPLDHAQRRTARRFNGRATLFGVGHHVLGDALDQCVFEPFFNHPFAPGEVLHIFLGLALHRLRKFDQCFTGTRIAIQHHILDLLLQRRIEIVVNTQLAGVNDAHGEPGLDRVVEEHGVDRLAHRVVAAEREAHI